MAKVQSKDQSRRQQHRTTFSIDDGGGHFGKHHRSACGSTCRMNHWQRTFEFQEMQDFNGVHAYISPTLYDDELDKLRRRICERTGRWLQREEALKEWMDASNGATRVFWMQGIPGAGKTHIASMMVEKLRQSSKTVLFAFLNYKQDDVTPVSIMYSLMFQLAIGDDQIDDLLKAIYVLRSPTNFARVSGI
jgi:hypothetical protein